MYGQTNCWVLPEGDYRAFQGRNNEVYVMSARCIAQQSSPSIFCAMPSSSLVILVMFTESQSSSNVFLPAHEAHMRA